MKAQIILYGAAPSDIGRSADLIICADSGYETARSAGIVPDLLIGDMDSISEEMVNMALEDGVEVFRYPNDKEKADGEIALETAMERGAEEIEIFGGVRGRFDHILSSVMHLRLLPREVKAVYRIGGAVLKVLRSGEKAEIVPEHEVISLISLTEECRVSTAGLRWELYGDTLKFGSSRGIHNESLGDHFLVDCHQGCLLVIMAKDPDEA